MKNLKPVQIEFFSGFGSLEMLLELFDHAPDVYVFIKNTGGQFMWMNRQLCEIHGLKSPEDYLEKTDMDFAPPDLAHGYMEEDRKIIETRKPILSRPWIVINKKGEQNWYISSKIPLNGPDNVVKGTAGVMRDCNKTGETLKPFQEMQEVIAYIFDHYTVKINISDLAAMLFISVSQFERRFHQIFRTTPQHFILKVRLDSAMRMLAETDLSITQIAQQTGFYDGSFFTKQFKKLLGLTPFEFRKKYVPKGRIPGMKRKRKPL